MNARACVETVLVDRGVRLEPLALTHVADLVAAASEDRSTYGLTFVPSDEAGMRAYVSAALEDQAAGRALPFATVDAPAGRVVGSTRFGNLEYWRWPEGSAQQRGPREPDAVEIGWTWLMASAQRTAINTEAKLLMLGHAFETWGVHRVTLRTDVRNARSRAAIERLGARLDGVLRAHVPAVDGGIRDSACYSILAAEWPAVRARLLTPREAELRIRTESQKTKSRDG
jgi:RimJ/RimL family protein N-acetyltransferase